MVVLMICNALKFIQKTFHLLMRQVVPMYVELVIL